MTTPDPTTTPPAHAEAVPTPRTDALISLIQSDWTSEQVRELLATGLSQLERELALGHKQFEQEAEAIRVAWLRDSMRLEHATEALRLSQLRVGALTEIAHDVEVMAIRVRRVLEGGEK